MLLKIFFIKVRFHGIFETFNEFIQAPVVIGFLGYTLGAKIFSI
jgi:hypothetical protein